MANKKFLIVQFGRLGDCLYATTVAQQIKNDNPQSHITWAIDTKFKSILLLNPHVDTVWDISAKGGEIGEEWTNFKLSVKERVLKGEFDEVFYTQWVPDWGNYDGTIRSSTYRGFNGAITVPINPVVRLNNEEVNHVKKFSETHHLSSYNHVILFECGPMSGQSFVNLAFATKMAEFITAKFNDICFILSSSSKFQHSNNRIIDGSLLTFRENAELTKYCTMLIGCSSGITWISTSDWAKPLNKVQLLNRDEGLYCGLKYDLEYWNVDTSTIIEITKKDINHILSCLTFMFENDFASTKIKFDEVYKPSYKNFQSIIISVMWGTQKDKLQRIKSIISLHCERNPHFNINWLYYFVVLEITLYFLKKNLAFLKKKRNLK